MNRGCLCCFFSSRRRHTRLFFDWSSDVCSSDLMIRRPPRSTLFPYTSEERRVGKECRSRRSPYHDRKSTRLNSSHTIISYAVSCFKKKKTTNTSIAHYNHNTPTFQYT